MGKTVVEKILARAAGLPEVSAGVAGILVGFGAGLLLGAVALVRQSGREDAPGTAGDIDVLIPRSRTERRWFAAVAVTAGITEEVFYRAFGLTLLLAVLPGGQWWAVLVAAVLFALGHVYQGAQGVLATGVLAVGFGALYLLTGSLLPSMLLHVLMDLRVLLIRVSESVAAVLPGRGGLCAP